MANTVMNQSQSNHAETNQEGKLWGKTKEEFYMIKETIPAGLDLYDVIAKPRFLPDEKILESTYDLTSSDLRTDLSCPICMGILQHTVVVKNCLHRFCADCMEKCVRIGIRECPQCRSHVASRRSLRSDPIFDHLIRRLFPDVKAFEDKNATLLAQANKRLSLRHEEEPRVAESDSARSRSASPSPNGGSPSTRCGVYISADGVMEFRNTQTTSSHNETPIVNEQKLTKSERRRKRKEMEAQIRKIPTDGLLHFELTPDPSIPNLRELEGGNKLTTDGLLTVQQLGRYLASLLQLYDDSPLKMYTKDHRLPFNPYESLAQVHHQSCGLSHETIVLYYTTRAYGDASGGVLKGTRGFVSPQQNILKKASAIQEFSQEESILT